MKVVITSKKIETLKQQGFSALADELQTILSRCSKQNSKNPRITIEVETIEPSRKFYVGEGMNFHFISPEGNKASVEVVAEHNIGGMRQAHNIGDKFHINDGDILISVHLFLGKYFITLYSTKPPMLGE